MNTRIMLITCILFILLSIITLNAEIKINEIVASNSESCFDENMDSPDWIELYNPGQEAVNLNGYRIFDNDDFNNAWVIPDTLLQPQEHIIIFVSDKDRVSSDIYVIESSGWGIAEHNSTDGMRFEYIPIAGDFDINVRFNSLRFDEFNTYASLMLREELTEGSRYAGMHCQNPDRAGYLFFYRDIENQNPKAVYFNNREIDYPDCRIRLKREGDSVFGFIYDENYIWYKKESFTYLPMINDTAYLGIAFASSVNNKLSRLAISELYLDGEPLSLAELTGIEINTGLKGKSYFSHELHSNFKLSSEGETLFLWNPTGDLVDKVEFGEQITDLSYGRYPDGTGIFEYFFPPTPERKNLKGYIGVASTPEFSNDGGWFDSQVNISLHISGVETDIYYTLDGSDPNLQSKKYTGTTINIDTTTVIRARAYKDNCYPSPIISNTYFINELISLQVVSLSTDPANLWNEDDGIFDNKNLYNKKEIPAQFELWGNDKKLKYEAGAGARVHGQLSKKFPQKSLRLYAKRKYGTKTFDYPFFGDSGMEEYERIILRNGGTEWWRTFLRDGFAAVITEQMTNLDGMAFSPAVMFINGSYYGIQNIRERIDETYIHLKYNVPYENLNLMEDWDVHLYGTTKGYHNMYDSILAYDMSTQDAYDFIDRNIEIANIIDYVALELYVANIDWPWKNLKYWNSPDYDNKWRWILNDMDYTCGIASWPQFDMMPFATDSTLIFSLMFPKLLENEKFRTQFINRTADLLNTVFKPDNMIGILDSLADILRPEIPRQHARYDSSAMEWEHEIDVVRDFLTRRPKYFPGHYVDYFKLSDTAHITLNVQPEGAGRIMISTIIPDNYPFEGVYFRDVPVKIRAIPEEGYKFSEWSDAEYTGYDITVLFSGDFNITAIFTKDNDRDTNIVINEIMYKANENMDSKDWIELYNAGKDIDLSNWILKDDNDGHEFSIPENTVLKMEEYLVICRDIEAFNEIYPEVENYIGVFDYGFGEDDIVRLLNKSGELIDIVDYQYNSPWPGNSNGTGYSLELRNPESDNNNAGNWKSSYVLYGTPGAKNSVLISVSESVVAEDLGLMNYPNPFSEKTEIKFNLSQSSVINLKIVNSMGFELDKLIDNKQYYPGIHRISFDSGNLESGVYYCTIKASGIVKTIPMIIMK
ncbi:CotH kinase family protein [Bacteroidota bacterium]